MSKLLVGRYELVEKIGEGGMAVVYKAKDRLLNRYVAVKILRPECTKDAQFVDSFRAESQAAAGLQHPNIISVYDVGREGNIHFIVMELIEGKSLSEIIKEQAPMDYREVVRITRQVASALSVAHKHNIIHRDIKPHNIMMTSDGMAKLGDFGIAKALSDSTMEETSKIIGSVHYISPEQARGAYVDERSDIYSLGIVMYEMLTGRVPFDGDTPVQVALMHINDDITPPSELVPEIPPALEKVVMKATDKFQTNRYASADDMLKDLDSIEYVSNVMGRNAFADQTDQPEVRKPRPAEKAEERTPAYSTKKTRKGLSPKARRTLTAAVLIALLAVIGAVALPKLLNSKTVAVPNVTDMSYAQAKTTLTDRGLKIKKGTSIASDDVEKGKVAAQDPSAGDQVKKGTTVTVNLSKGDSNGEVPNLVGQTYDSSTRDIIDAAGFNLGDVTYAYSDSYDKGEIMSQTPSAGSKAEEGSDIDLVVSKGSKSDNNNNQNEDEDTAEVPSVTGLSVSAARAKLAAAGFSVSVDYEESNVTASGQVISQSVSAGSKAKKGSTVTITVSKNSSSDNNGGGDNNNNNNNRGDNDNSNTSDNGGSTEGNTDSSTSRSSGSASSAQSSQTSRNASAAQSSASSDHA